MSLSIDHFFAWADANEPFDPLVHRRKDEDVFKADVEQSEGDFATLTVVVKNPRIGLLAPARRVWAWLSIADGETVTPLFYGRLVGLPTDINTEYVTMLFNARPEDFSSIKSLFAETLKVRPHYDPIWIDPSSLDDPDTVLEARSALWSINRVTHELGISDILVGEDGNEDFLESEVPFDSVSISLGQAPLRSVTIDAVVNWTQSHVGEIDMGDKVFESLTGQSLLNDWPKTGTSLGGGWVVARAAATDLNNVANAKTISASHTWQNQEKTHNHGDTMSRSLSYTVIDPAEVSSSVFLGTQWNLTKYQTGILDKDGDPPINRPAETSGDRIYVLKWAVGTSLVLTYDAKRPRQERARFTLATDVQPIVTLPGDAENEIIKISSVDVGLPLVDEVPLVDPARRSYFPTDRGLWSLEYLIVLARARLLSRSRTVEITFSCPFMRAINLSCRKNARLFDHRLPGHQALGKIISYRFGIDGTSGLAIGSVTIGCAIGYAGSVASSDGDPIYVADGYVDDYQVYTNKVVVLPASDVAYTVPVDSPNDDGLTFPLSKRQIVVREEVHGSVEDQENLIDLGITVHNRSLTGQRLRQLDANEIALSASLRDKTAEEILKGHEVWYDLELKPVNSGAFDNAYDIVVSDLKVPKMIDLEAAT